MKRLAGSRSPSTLTRNFSFESPSFLIRLLAPLLRDQAQWLLVHRRIEDVGFAAGQAGLGEVHPLERVQRAFMGRRVAFQALF